MKTIIYYFSATGNSLKTAIDLSNKLYDCEISSIPNLIDEDSIELTHENVGIVFPTYAWGMPRIVADFVNKLVAVDVKYFFAVTTCVAISGNTLVDLKKSIGKRGIKLNAGFVVKAGRSSLMKLNTFDKIIMKLDRSRFMLKTSDERLIEIADVIRNQRKHKPETSNWAANVFGSMLHNMGINSFKIKDGEFEINGNCGGCGNCTKICPRNNITIERGKPAFHNNCELCHACIQWCPNFAIRHQEFDEVPIQYRNQAIRFKQMVLR